MPALEAAAAARRAATGASRRRAAPKPHWTRRARSTPAGFRVPTMSAAPRRRRARRLWRRMLARHRRRRRAPVRRRDRLRKPPPTRPPASSRCMQVSNVAERAAREVADLERRPAERAATRSALETALASSSPTALEQRPLQAARGWCSRRRRRGRLPRGRRRRGERRPHRTVARGRSREGVRTPLELLARGIHARRQIDGRQLRLHNPWLRHSHAACTLL